MWGRVCVTGLCTVCLAGCLTRDALYDELLETRDEAYDAWRGYVKTGHPGPRREPLAG